jgi:hypothetical protein
VSALEAQIGRHDGDMRYHHCWADGHYTHMVDSRTSPFSHIGLCERHGTEIIGPIEPEAHVLGLVGCLL